MHPEIARELTSQRGREMRVRAHQDMLARTAARIRRARRHGHGEADEAEVLVMPVILDYVDGSFQAPTAGRAA
jgi:hypothetical protein